jgi:hypothetical protein
MVYYIIYNHVTEHSTYLNVYAPTGEQKKRKTSIPQASIDHNGYHAPAAKHLKLPVKLLNSRVLLVTSHVMSITLTIFCVLLCFPHNQETTFLSKRKLFSKL